MVAHGSVQHSTLFLEQTLFCREVQELKTTISRATREMERLVDGMENGVREHMQRYSRWEYAPFCEALYISLRFKSFSYWKPVTTMLFKHYTRIFDRLSTRWMFNFPTIEHSVMRRNCISVFFVLPILIMNGRTTYCFWKNSLNSSWLHGMKTLSSTFIIIFRVTRTVRYFRLFSSLGIGITTNHCAFLGQLAQWHKPKQPLVTIILDSNINFLLKTMSFKRSDRTWIRYDNKCLCVRMWTMKYLKFAFWWGIYDVFWWASSQSRICNNTANIIINCSIILYVALTHVMYC